MVWFGEGVGLGGLETFPVAGWRERTGRSGVALVRERAGEYGREQSSGLESGGWESGGLDPARVELGIRTDSGSELTANLRAFCRDPETQETEELGEAIVTLSAHLHAGDHRLLLLVAEFERRGGWKGGGHRSCAHWLAFRTGISLGAARERVRAARALEKLPRTSEAMSRGELSFSKVRALTRVADDLETPEQEEALLDYARQCTAAQVEVIIRGWKKLSRKEELDVERERHRSRFLSVSPDEDGMYRVRGRLDPEVGALLMRALEAAGDALFRSDRDWAPEGGTRGPVVQEITPRQRRADGLGLVVEQAMRMGFGWRDGESGKGDAGKEVDEDASAETRHEPGAYEDGSHGMWVDEAQASDGDRAPISGTRPERYQVVLHVDAATLRSNDGDGQGARTKGSISHVPGRSHLSDGTRVSAETSRRLCCDAGVVQAMRGSEGEVLDVGRRTRTIPPALRRALEIRDRGCRFPGCGLRFTEAHHIVHWADGGETKLSNLVLLCRFHHRAVHEEGFTVRILRGRFGPRGISGGSGGAGGSEGAGGNRGSGGGQGSRPTDPIRFFDRTGWPLPDAAPPPALGNPLSALLRTQRRQGVRPDGNTASARWRRLGDIPWELEARAREALDS